MKRKEKPTTGIAKDDKSAEALTLTVPGVAQRLNVSERFVWKEIDERKLGHLRCGRRVLITVDQLNTYIAKNSVDPFNAKARAQEIVGG